jgi:hypothetical protein
LNTMKFHKNWIYVIFCLCTIIFVEGNAIAQIKPSSDSEIDGQKKENINEKSALAIRGLIEKLETGGGDANKIVGAIGKKYPGYQILSACAGSFRREGLTDIALGIFNPRLQMGAYVGVLKNGTADEIVEVERFKAEFNKMGYLPKDIEVTCNSWTEILRIAEIYKVVRSDTPAASANLRPISHFDAVCTVPFGRVEEYICYGYDQKKKGFANIGGWFND